MMPLRHVVQAGLCVFIWTAPLLAQDFRVSTKLYDERSPERPAEAPQPIARSWTIFHAGKVFDYVDVAGETTIFEPALERFIVLNTNRNLATELTFRQIDTVIHRAHSRAKQKLAEVPDALHGKAIAFQLKPSFQTSFHAKSKTLNLTSSCFRYDARCDEVAEERVAAYLRYANWTAKLNYVLHGQLLPGVRMALNTELEKRSLLPTEIRLQSQLGTGLKLRAEHRYSWTLTSEDRRMISDWESALQNPRLRRLPFDQFQQELASN